MILPAVLGYRECLMSNIDIDIILQTLRHMIQIFHE